MLRPTDRSAAALRTLPLLAAVAAAEALRSAAGVTCELRWPNDLFAAGRKIGGVLCESSFSGSLCEFAIVGIGVNVETTASELTPETARRAISVRELTGSDVDPDSLGVSIVLALELWWERREPSEVLARWRELSHGLEGERIRVVPRDAESYEAWTAGLSEDGGLRVRLADGTDRVLHSDDVQKLDP